MNALSPWGTAVKNLFHEKDKPTIFQKQIKGYTVKIHDFNNSLWIVIACPQGTQVIIRPAYAPNDQLQIKSITKKEDGIVIRLSAAIGQYQVKVQLPDEQMPLVHYTTTFKGHEPLLIPYWPRDVVVAAPAGSAIDPKGTIYVSQVGTRSGLQYFSIDKPKSGAVLYFQNLTALNEYAQATETSLGDTVGGTWPEMGFALPPTLKGKPLPANKEIVLSDALIAFSPDNPNNEFDQGKQFLNLLADIYLHISKPETKFYNWIDMVDKGLHDLEYSHGCWSHGAEQDYLNAYVADYQTPPELMVQLAVLLPLTDYHDWCKTDLPAIMKIKNGLDAFYNDSLKTVVRFLPALADELSGAEEQLKPNVMDSWYLHHPLLNLGRLAIRGDKQAKKLFLNSLDFAIRVARHFNYNWPVMYNMENLEVVKAETQPGKGGEKDVAGLYALVMLHAWQLTKLNKYLQEAKKAAKTLAGKGFELFYQANNTAFGANAMLWLYQETKEKTYLNLAYLCLANIFKNIQLWECNYGYARYYPTFFAVFPLNDAPYTAAYEEQEVFAAMHNFLLYIKDDEVLPSVAMLIPEFLKYIVNRASYYYPPNLPKEMLSDEIKTGQVDPKLWIAIEDLHDGWEQSGTVGQEVYGAGVCFGIIPRHFYKVPNQNFMIYIDYPTADYKYSKGKVTLRIRGDKQLNCRMLIIPQKGEKLPAITTVTESHELKGHLHKDGFMEYTAGGNQQLTIKWKP